MSLRASLFIWMRWNLLSVLSVIVARGLWFGGFVCPVARYRGAMKVSRVRVRMRPVMTLLSAYGVVRRVFDHCFSGFCLC